MMVDFLCPAIPCSAVAGTRDCIPHANTHDPAHRRSSCSAPCLDLPSRSPRAPRRHVQSAHPRPAERSRSIPRRSRSEQLCRATATQSRSLQSAGERRVGCADMRFARGSSTRHSAGMERMLTIAAPRNDDLGWGSERDVPQCGLSHSVVTWWGASGPYWQRAAATGSGNGQQYRGEAQGVARRRPRHSPRNT